MNEKHRWRVFAGCLRRGGAACFLILAGVLVLPVSLTGCAGPGERPDSKIGTRGGRLTAETGDRDDDWQDVFRDGGERSNGNSVGGGAGGSGSAGGRWTIVMATFGVAEHRRSAEDYREALIGATGMTGFEITSRSDRSIIHYGQYLEPSTARIRADLEVIHAIQFEGRTPFARAFPTVVIPSEIGQYPQFNLVQLWQDYPGADVLYSLQIGFYSFDDAKSQAEARETAETAVAHLRTEGDAAFYYHGPRMSMVTVGVFFEHDVDVVTGLSRAVRQLQTRYPRNLDNGHEIIETKRLRNGKTERRVQPSFLINVPKQ